MDKVAGAGAQAEESGFMDASITCGYRSEEGGKGIITRDDIALLAADTLEDQKLTILQQGGMSRGELKNCTDRGIGDYELVELDEPVPSGVESVPFKYKVLDPYGGLLDQYNNTDKFISHRQPHLIRSKLMVRLIDVLRELRETLGGGF